MSALVLLHTDVTAPPDIIRLFFSKPFSSTLSSNNEKKKVKIKKIALTKKENVIFESSD